MKDSEQGGRDLVFRGGGSATESHVMGENIGKTFPLAFSALRTGLNGQK